MMTNLFSMFDPSMSYMSLSWMMIPLAVMVASKKISKSNTKKMMILNNIKQSIKKEMEELTKSSTVKGSTTLLSSMFVMLMIINLVAIMPFNFASTAHMSFCMSISLIMWLAVMLNALWNSFKSTLAHLTPMGTPNSLMNFMVIIEMVSICIRPITLSVRLTANMVAGHLLMSLLSSFSMIQSTNKIMAIFPMMVLISLEMAVAIIQAYVISILVTLYYKESF